MSLSNKVAGLNAWNFIKKRLQQLFSREFWKFVQTEYKNVDFFHFQQSLTSLTKINLLRQFCFSNKLPSQIRKITEFPWEKPWKMPSAMANFQGCDQHDLEAKKDNMNNASSYFKLNGRPSIVQNSFSIKLRLRYQMRKYLNYRWL